MAENTISLNLRRLRKAKDFSQERLAEKSGLSRAAYRNIETGQSEPRVSNLQAIASALEVPIQRLIEPVQELRAVRFRSNKKMRSREQVLVDVGRWLADFSDLENILNDRESYHLDGICKQMKVRKNRGEVAAALAREAFGLNAEEPIRDICGLLESGGIKVGEQKVASHDFFGLSVAATEGGPAVVVNTWDRISVERWIFTAAHELGHLILHLSDYDVAHIDEEQAHEQEANAFAAAFLMPDVSFRKEWNDTYGLAFVERVLKVKRIFRVSYRTVLYRLAPDYPGPDNIWARFQMEYRHRTGRTLLRDDEPNALAQDAFRASFPEGRSAGEPDSLSPVDFIQDRLSRLVRKAIEQEKISLGRGAEVLGISLKDMRDLTASWVG
ncbi:MAG: ImmA/IrrE family metallo-endopeptidase [Proteobacteria bacterium]|nr:ImmA/IrrE family metallo-endopeptidase [Pseudomonadota bacterium]